MRRTRVVGGATASPTAPAVLRGTSVPDMMVRVERALMQAARSPADAQEVIYVTPDDGQHPLSGLRHVGNIQIEFYSGSDRPVVGSAVRFAKQAMRRALRWYVGPIMEQQTRFNQAAVDEIERLRHMNERPAAEVEALSGLPPGDGRLGGRV